MATYEPPRHNITLYQNSTFDMVVEYRDADGGAITDIDSAQMHIKTNKGDTFAARLLGLTTASGITLTAASGRLDIKITDEQTEALTPGSAYYDLVIEDTSGNRYVILQGDVEIKQGVTSWQT